MEKNKNKIGELGGGIPPRHLVELIKGLYPLFLTPNYYKACKVNSYNSVYKNECLRGIEETIKRIGEVYVITGIEMGELERELQEYHKNCVCRRSSRECKPDQLEEIYRNIKNVLDKEMIEP